MYSPDNVGHFGLAYELTPTSPRRFAGIPDCWCTAPSRPSTAGRPVRPRKPGRRWKNLFDDRTPRRRRHPRCGRLAEVLLHARQDWAVFTGKIRAVTSFGVFVLLDDVHIEGLLHI